MHLQNPFPLKVRKQYIDVWYCWNCGCNGSDIGGLEIHHIRSRISDSIFNSSCLCKLCHSKIGHSQEEEQELFAKTFKWVYNIKYKPDKNDIDFLEKNYDYLFTDELKEWLKNLN